MEVSGVEPLSLEIANLTVHTVCFIRYIFGLSFEKSHLKRGADWIVSSSTSYLGIAAVLPGFCSQAHWQLGLTQRL